MPPGTTTPADPVAARQIAADRERGSSASAALQRVLDRRGKRAAYRPLPPRRLRRAVQRQGMVLSARRRGPGEASFVGTSVGEDRDAGSGGPLDREPFGSLSIDRVGSGLGSRELLAMLAGLAVFVAAIARVRRRI